MCKVVSYNGEVMRKSFKLDITQLVEAGVTPQYAFEKNYLSDPRC